MTLLLIVWLAVAPPIYCWEVKAYVSMYGEAAAIDWARKQGYTTKQIEAIKLKCKGS